ncbi:MAG: AI-2E family transporter [Gammaproteobacteria bacterium]
MNDSTQAPAPGPAGAAGHANNGAHGPLRVLLGLAAFVIVAQGVSSARSMIEPLLLALLLAIGLAPAVALLARRRVPVALAILLVMLALVGLGAGVTALFLQSVNDFAQNLPQYEVKLHDGAFATAAWINSLHPAINTATLLDGLNPAVAMDYAGTLLSGFGNLLTSALLILVVVVFLLLEATSFRRKVELAGSDPARSAALLARFDRVAASVNRYIALKTLFSFINGFAVTIFLWIAGVDYALLWGVLAFLLNFVPGIGQPLSIIPPMLMAWLQGGVDLMIVAGAGCLVIGTLVGNWLEPKYMGEGLGLSTFVVILSLVLWGWVLGPVGMLLSVPLTMIAKIVLEAHPATHAAAVMLGTGREAQAHPQASSPATPQGNPPMFKVNEYFDGKVKSISFQSARGAATSGVMAAGEYEFNTGKPEIMVITSGAADVQLKGETTWTRYGAGGTFEVPGNSSFRIKLATDTTYLCYFVG